MSIKSKLFAVFAVNSILMVTIILLFFNNLRGISMHFNDVSKTTTPAIILLNSMSESFFLGANNALMYPIIGDRAIKNEYQKNIDTFDTLEAKLIELVSDGNTVAPEEDAKLLKEIDVARDEFQKAVNILFAHYEREGALYKNHDDGQTMADNEDVLRVTGSIDTMTPLLNEWIAMEKGEVAEAQERVDRAVQLSMTLVGIIGFVLLLVTLFTHYWVFRSTINPLTILNAATRAMANGELSTRADIQGKDEFGMLGESFNEMAQVIEESRINLEAKVRERTKELEEIKASLEEKNQEIVAKMRDAEEMNEMMVGREAKMIELKKEIEVLRKQNLA